jgi:hypothetical protein
MWFTSSEAGIWLEDHSGDCFVDESVGEYNFGGFLHFADNTSECTIRNSNLWASSTDRYQYGIWSAGSSVKVLGTKFVGYAGAAVQAGGGVVQASDNEIISCAVGVAAAGGGSVISGNAFYGRGSGPTGPLPGSALISLQPAAHSSGSFVLSNNLVEDTDSPASNPTIVIGQNASGVISGNAIRKVNVSSADAAATTTRVYMIDVAPGSVGAGAAEGEGPGAMMLITGNVFRAGVQGGLAVKGSAIAPEFAGMVTNNLGG